MVWVTEMGLFCFRDPMIGPETASDSPKSREQAGLVGVRRHKFRGRAANGQSYPLQGPIFHPLGIETFKVSPLRVSDRVD